MKLMMSKKIGYFAEVLEESEEWGCACMKGPNGASLHLHATRAGGKREGKIKEGEDESKRRQLSVLDGHVVA